MDDVGDTQGVVENIQDDVSMAPESEIISVGDNNDAYQQSEKGSEKSSAEQETDNSAESVSAPEPATASIPALASESTAEPATEPVPETETETEPSSVSEEEEGGEGGDIYTVEAVVDDRIIGGQKYYLLKWEGYGSEENTWEPVDDNFQCMDLANDYERRKKMKTFGALYPKGFSLSRLYNVPSLHKIRVINEVDEAQLPEDFVYTDGYIRGKGVPYPSGVVFPCSCTGAKCGVDCECMGVSCYDDRGRLCVELQYPIHECNYLCKCSINCPNRIVQRGNPIQLDVFRTILKGWGVRTRRIIYKGEYVCRYTGELITFEESTLRDLEQTTYLFDLDHEIPRKLDNHYAIDACKYGNVSHFLNHSCDPNLEIRAVYINHLDPLMHELAFFASKDIAVEEELTFDYSPGLNINAQSDTQDTGSPLDESKNFRCYCGTSCCRKYIFN
ncbi:hypothetical protein FB645_004187 [Coemansia sp. IMI 203386]|nr:hypothetical protein FB645_004187 [Coemansia sp. IMI 203386]